MIRKDAYSIHEKLDGAKMKATIYSAPINYKDENDEWKEIVTDLDTKVNWETEYCVEKNNFKTYFNDMTDPINPTLASFEYDGKWINYKMVDAEPEEIIVDKSKILWREVKPYIDLEYEITSAKLKENIIIKHQDGVDDLEFTIKSNANLEDFNIELFAVDAEGNSGEVDYLLTTQIYDGKEYESILLLPNEEFLNNAVYPVVIDPTTTVQPDAAAGKDTFANQGSAATNYGTGIAMYVTGSTTDKQISFIDFVYPSISNEILSQKINLYQESSTAGASSPINIYKVLTSWDEGTLTWNLQPTIDTTALDTATVTTVLGWYDWDINGDSDYGWAFSTDVTADKAHSFYTSDYAVDTDKRPKLVIIYRNDAPTITSLTSTTESQPQILTDTTPNITWSMAYNATDYEVEIYDNSDDSTVIDTGKVSLTMSSGSSYTYTVSSALDYDTVYKARLRVWDSDGYYSEWSDYYYFVVFENKMTFYGNSIIDRVKIVDYTMTASEISALAISDTVTWDDDTLFLANFEQTLDGGNILNLSSELTGFKVTRIEASDSLYSNINTLDSDEISYEDFEIYPNKNYKYRIYPITATEIGDAMETDYIESDLEAWYISNQVTGESYKIDCNVQSSVVQINKDYTQYETFTQFPAFSFGNNDYVSGNISGVLDLSTSVTTLESFRSFINDEQEKVLKNRKGDAWKVVTHSNSRNYLDEYEEQIVTVGFNFVQVGEV